MPESIYATKRNHIHCYRSENLKPHKCILSGWESMKFLLWFETLWQFTAAVMNGGPDFKNPSGP
jgi:hypothetical protein